MIAAEGEGVPGGWWYILLEATGWCGEIEGSNKGNCLVCQIDGVQPGNEASGIGWVWWSMENTVAVSDDAVD